MQWTAVIDSARYWNPTGIRLEENKAYSFRADGKWCDASHCCDADGWSPPWNKIALGLLDLSKRQKGAPLFKLIGAVEKSQPFIVLGKSGTFRSPANGELFCFANDVPGFYGNNSGSVKLMIDEAL